MDRRGDERAAADAGQPAQCQHHRRMLDEPLLERGRDDRAGTIVRRGPLGGIDDRARRHRPRWKPTAEIRSRQPRTVDDDVVRQASWSKPRWDVNVHATRLIPVKAERGESGSAGKGCRSAVPRREGTHPRPLAGSQSGVVRNIDAAMRERPAAGGDPMSKTRHRHESQRLPPADHAVLPEQHPVEVVGVIRGHR